MCQFYSLEYEVINCGMLVKHQWNIFRKSRVIFSWMIMFHVFKNSRLNWAIVPAGTRALFQDIWPIQLEGLYFTLILKDVSQTQAR